MYCSASATLSIKSSWRIAVMVRLDGLRGGQCAARCAVAIRSVYAMTNSETTNVSMKPASAFCDLESDETVSMACGENWTEPDFTPPPPAADRFGLARRLLAIIRQKGPIARRWDKTQLRRGCNERHRIGPAGTSRFSAARGVRKAGEHLRHGRLRGPVRRGREGLRRLLGAPGEG